MKWMVMVLFAAPAFACHAVDGDRIFAKDLAAAVPAFAALDPQTPIAASPVPGAMRVMHPLELYRLAKANGIVLAAAPEVCFERYTEPLSAEKLLPVLRDALGLDGAKIEILDFSRAGVPRGSFLFTRSGLSATGLWHGQVMYSQARSVPVWVRVRVTVECTWVEAAQPIAAGNTIDAVQLRIRSGPRFPFGVAPLRSMDRVAGRAALRRIQPGEEIFANMLTNPREVERGDSVSVRVTSGQARIDFDGTAESSGHTGDVIVVRNPENGRYFQAKITAKDKVEIIK